jgi:serine protease Do
MFRAVAFVAIILAAGALSAQTQPRSKPAQARRATRAGYLGVGVTDLSADRAKALNLNETSGVEVKRVTPGSPAAKAGLKESDVVLDVNGKPIDNVEQFIQSISGTAPGTMLSLGVWRNGSKQTLTATVESRPSSFFEPFEPGAGFPPLPPIPPQIGGRDFPMMGDTPRVGFEGEVLSPQLAAYFGVKDGVLVRTVNPRTPAEKAGLKAGDVVTNVDGKAVASPQEIAAMVRGITGRAVPFTVVRNHKEMTLNVDLAAAGQPDAQPDRLRL